MYKITINNDSYKIPTKTLYNRLLNLFFNTIFSNIIEPSSDIVHKVVFINNKKTDLLISLTNREYISDLLKVYYESINHKI
jgi:hypothetical protein